MATATRSPLLSWTTVLPVAAPLTALLTATLGTLAVAYSTDLARRRRMRAAFARFAVSTSASRSCESSVAISLRTAIPGYGTGDAGA